VIGELSPYKTTALEVPVGNGVATIPVRMTEEDFTLLIETLQLWKKKIVFAPEPPNEQAWPKKIDGLPPISP